MGFWSTDSGDTRRVRRLLLSKGHNPPRYVDDELPTLPVGIFGDGGPAKPFPRSQGTNPWIAGSFTIGTNRIFVMDQYDFNTGSPNVWWKLRHNHSGTNASVPGGTIWAKHQPARGNLSGEDSSGKGILRIRGPGTISLYGFGAGSFGIGTTSNLVHRAMGTRGTDRYSGQIRGYIV